MVNTIIEITCLVPNIFHNVVCPGSAVRGGSIVQIGNEVNAKGFELVVKNPVKEEEGSNRPENLV